MLGHMISWLVPASGVNLTNFWKLFPTWAEGGKNEGMECGSLLPLSPGQPTVRRRCRWGEKENARCSLVPGLPGSQQAADPKAAEGCTQSKLLQRPENASHRREKNHTFLPVLSENDVLPE